VAFAIVAERHPCYPPVNIAEIVDRNGIGWSDTPRIEHRAPRQAPLILLSPKMRWMLPARIDARCPLLHVEQIETASAVDPIRDAPPPDARAYRTGGTAIASTSDVT
jgi:hypothetical protein